MKPGLLLRADGGPGIGNGHLGRCLALAQAWTDLKGHTTLRTSHIPDTWRERFEYEGVTVDDRRAQDHHRGDFDWCAVDLMHTEESDLAWARDHSARVMVVDDRATAPTPGSQLTINQNLVLDPTIQSGGAFLVGPRYALLRRELRNRISVLEGPRTKKSVERLLVSLGGAPSEWLVGFFNEVLSAVGLSSVQKCFLKGTDDVGEEMAVADLALAAAGTTAWELCGFGVPSVLMSVANDQALVAIPLSDWGAAVYVGAADQSDPARVSATLVELASDPDRRTELSSAAMSLVDGLGAMRIVSRMRADLLRARDATPSDARTLWEWANDPETRRWSFSPDLIPWEGHVSWLNEVLESPTRRLFVVEDVTGAPIGQVRFDETDPPAGTVEVSFSVSPASRGFGWGPAMIDHCVREQFATTTTSRVLARIVPDNERSGRALRHADFDQAGKIKRADSEWCEFVRDRSGDQRARLVAS